MKKIEPYNYMSVPEGTFDFYLNEKINELIVAVNELIETTIQIKSGSGPIQGDYQEFKKDK